MTRTVTAETRGNLEEWEGVVLYAYNGANGNKVLPGDPVRGTLTIGGDEATGR